MAALACASLASAQVALFAPNPAAAQPGQTVTVGGLGFPATGTINPANVSVTITPPAGNGSPVTIAAGSVNPSSVPPGSGLIRAVQFAVPVSLTTSTPLICQVSMTDTAATDADFTTAVTTTLEIDPPPTVTSASPGAVQLGQNGVSLAIVGAYTQFTSHTTVMLTLTQTSPANTITINQIFGSTVYGDQQHVSASFNIPGGLNAVPLGAYTVTATTGSETAVLPGGLLVAASGPLSLTSITPNSIPAGQVTLVTVVGSGTHFVDGTTVASFGDGITPGLVSVSDATDATFFIATDPIAFLGGRTLTMATGGEFATGGFALTNNGASLTTVGTTAPAVCASACSGPQGTNATLTLTGAGTHWAPAAAMVSVGGGINSGNVTVTGTHTLLVNISIGPGVAVGSYPVTVTTHGEVVSLANAISVTAATPYLTNAAPNQGAQGQQHETVTFTGVLTSFNVGALSANFGPNITVNSITPAAGAAGATSATADISIDFTAFSGSRSGALTSNGTIFDFTFTVTPSSAALTSSTPNSGLQGASMALAVTSANTHWQQGLTFASLGAGIVVNRVIICPGSAPSTAICTNAPATTAEVDISIPTNAGLGLTGLTMSTGGEIVSLSNAFTVLPYTPSLTMAPSSGMIPPNPPSQGMTPVAPSTLTIVNVTFQGNFTHFVLNSTVAAIDGNGVAIQNFKVINEWNATAQFYITAPLSQASPALPCSNSYGGNHLVTLETPIATGSEIVYTGFCVTSTPAVLTSITPYHSAEPMNNLNVTITGQYTHFEGPSATNPTGTTVGFGPNITVLPGSINIVNATTLTATIDIAANAVLGWRPVFVNTVDPTGCPGTATTCTIDEELTIGFALDPPATSSLLSVLPSSGVQGQSLTVQITGNLTNWVQGNTVAYFGTGISVNTLTINSTASATAQISIDPVNAPIGGGSVTMVTQLASGNEEVVSGPSFSVTQGIAAIDHTGPSCPTDGTYSPINVLRISGRPLDTSAGGAGCQQHLLKLYQGTITPLFLVVGTNTHWNVTSNETVLNFGSDIAVSQLTVLSPTVLECQIAVSYTAALGYRGFTATTNAEVASSFSDALDILPVQGSSVNITPTSGQQGTTFTVQVNGTNTHWTSTAGAPNNTTANFGNNNGVNVTGITVVSPTQMNLAVQVLGTAYVGPYTLTITTTGLPIGPPPASPQSTEQIVATNILGIGPGVAIITAVGPTSGAQNGTGQINVTGQNTTFQTGLTTAYYSTGGCNPPTSAGINVSNVTASDHTHATLAIAVSATAPTGYQTLCMYTQGESVSYSNAFEILPGNPTLNEVSITGPAPATGTSAQQGETVDISILGQYTHWTQGITKVTFGQGITVSNLTIVSPASATATLTIDGDAYIGGRQTTVTTNNEIVSGNFFSVTQSDAIITAIAPTTANQGQHILMTITGNFTHWSQELTQFSIAGGGYDIKVNGVVINSPTQALADLSILNISGNAGLGTRSIYMSTVGENVSLQSALLITGGVPDITSVSPGYGTQSDTADNVIITGQFTVWDSTSVVDFGDPCIVVAPSSTVNSNTSITAVIAIGAAGSACPATTGVHTVTVRTGVSPDFTVQLGQFSVYSKAAPPAPYISYEYPSVALVGQTLAVNLDGAYTNWTPGNTTVSFGAGIQVNTVALQELDVTSPTSATANITIEPGATVGPRTVTVTTGSQTLTTTFYVTVGTPEITLVSTNSAAQGETRLLDLVGQYTTWDNTTQFSFCSGIDSVSNVQVFGPTAARVQVMVDPLASTGYCGVTATTTTTAGTQVVGLGGGGYFYITPSTATITSVTPNTAVQNSTVMGVVVKGFATLWTPATVFSFGGGVNVISQNVTGNTDATLDLTLDLYASPGERNLTATTGGEVATLDNAFVVKPGTPLLLSLTNSSNQQQAAFSLGILGQYTAWTGSNTTVKFPNGGVTGVSVNVTGAQSITVTGTVLPTAYPGCGPVVVTTTGQIPPVLTIYSFCISPGPAAVTGISVVNSGAPAPLNPLTSIGQGALNTTINITGTNTNFSQGTTVATFGPGISVNTLTINSPTSATAVVTVNTFATPEANTVTLTTAGETASDPSSLTIFATTPVVLDVYPNSATQSQTLDVCITAAYTHFVEGNTTANFGPGIKINATHIANLSACSSQGSSFVNDGTHADVNISILPTALTTPGNTDHVSLVTNLATTPVTQEVAVWENSSATTQYNFSIAAGGASITSATPFSPATVHQSDVGDVIHILGNGTHFNTPTLTPVIAFCGGVTVIGQSVVDALHITATVNVGTYTTVGGCSLTVTTGGEVATNTNVFSVLAGLPVITQVSPNSEAQNAGQAAPIAVTVTGLYTHFTSGGLTVTFPVGVTGAIQPGYTDTAVTVNVQVSPGAALGAGTVAVTDTTDGVIDTGLGLTSIPGATGFTVTAGAPALISVSPNTGPQGSSQTVTLTGNYTAWTASSVVTISGPTDVTITGTPVVTSLANGYQQTLAVTFNVTNGATAGLRTVYVKTGAQQLYLSNSFTVQPGQPNITQISPNIGIPNSNVTITITGNNFTNWDSTTTIQVGTLLNNGGITVNAFAAGAPATPTTYSASSLTAKLAIPSGSATGVAYNVTVATSSGATPTITQTNGFTVEANTTTAPVVTFISPNNGASSVPTNTQVTVTFSEPLNPATVPANGANAFILDTTTQGGCWQASGLPATVTMDASNRILTITPTNPLAVGRSFNLQLNDPYGLPAGVPTIADQSGNHLTYYCNSFTTGFGPVLTGPMFVSANIPDGAIDVPTNTQKVTLGFNQPIDPATDAAGLSITTGAVPVAGTWSYNTTYTESIFTPSSAWTPSTTYTVNYGAALQGLSGNALTNPGSLTFKTSTGTDTISGGYSTWTPPYTGAAITTGTAPTIRFIYDKPINPLTVTPSNFYVYDVVNSATVLGSYVTYSPDFRTFTLNLIAPLAPDTYYNWVLNGATDWVGNGVAYGSVYFTTAAGPDTTTPTVLTISPSAAVTCGAAPCAPVNSTIEIQFSEIMDPTSLTAGAVTLTPTAPAGPAVAGAFSFSPNFACTSPSSSGSCNFSELSFRPTANLSPSTTYQVSIPSGGLQDTSGNFDPFTSSFTTGSSATPDTAHGTISGITPSSNATNVPLTTSVVAQLSKPVDPLTVTDNTLRSYSQNSFVVYDQTASVNVPGTVSVSTDLQTVTFTQAAPFEPNHQFCMYASYFVSFYDLAGNNFSSTYQCFTTGAGTDTTVPTVISVTPVNNATGIGPNNPVMVTFSKSISSSTLNNNVAIYNGSTLLVSNSYNLSGDGTTLTFNSGNLPYSRTLTVVVNANVADLAGNRLAAEFSSTFTTGAQPVTAQPTVTTMRPGNGATGVGAATPITFYFSAPMNPATLNATSFVISQNGSAITAAGTLTPSAGNQSVTFVPAGGQFQAGALIQVWITSAATDSFGNPMSGNNFQSSFTIQADLSATHPTPVSYNPCYGCTVDRNAVVEILLNKPINPTTFIPANFYVTDSSSNPVTGSISLLDNGRLMRFQLPAGGQFAAGSYYYVHASANLQDLNNLSYTGNTDYYFYTNTTSNAAAPSVTSAAPTNGATGIGVNALISLTFSGNVDGNTLDPSMVTLNGGAIPLSISYNSSTFTVTVTPQAPLPASANVTLTLNGITDPDGNALSPTPYTLTFQTAATPDYSGPSLIETNLTNNQTEVPVNTSITLIFSKPINWASVIYGNTIYLQDNTVGGIVPGAATQIGSNGILLTHTAALSVNHTYQVLGSSIRDLNGNTGGGYMVNIVFTTVLVAPAGGPVETQIIPPNGSTGVPVNFRPMVQFDRPVDPAALSGVTLTQGGSPVATTPVLSAGGTVLTLVPNSILTPNLPYVFTVSGTTDAAGNAQSGSVTRSFTTGAGIDLTAPTEVSLTPIDNSTTGENPILEIVFSEPLNPILSASFTFYNDLTNRTVTGTALSWSTDFTSVRFTYPGALEPGSQYYWYINTMADLAGNTRGGSGEYFYTSSGTDATAETVTTVTPPNGIGGVALNALITLDLAKPADPLSITNSSVTLSPAVSGYNVQLSSNGMTITLSYASLAPSTPYTINVPAGGFTDENGNAVAVFSSTFITGTSTDSSHGTISQTSPAPGALGIALTQAITVTFSKPIDPNSLSGQYFVVDDNNNGSFQIAGTTTNPTPTTLVFTPLVAYPVNTRIDFYVGNYVSILDLAGNNFSSLSDGYFTTANVSDTTPPKVISITPANGATNVGPGPNPQVIITFNKSLNYNTISSANFALYNGPTNLGASVSYSADRSIVTLGTTLPYSSTLTVAISTNVTDYNGNNMASPCTAPLTSQCTSSFTTETPPLNFNPSVSQERPTGSGAALTNPITLFMNSTMNLSTVEAGMFVVQNGVLISPSSIALTADQHGIVWAPPAGGFAAGALIEVYLYPPAADTSGNVVSNWSGYSFHTATAPSLTTAPTETAYNPGRYAYVYLTDPVVEVQFSEPLNPATVTSSTAFVQLSNTGAAISGTPVLLNNNTLLRIPLASLPLSVTNYYYVTLTTGIQDADGNAFAGDNYYFYVYNTAVADNTPPTVQAVTPANLATGIGDNAPVRLVFSKLVDTLTINPSTVSLLNGATVLPYTISFSTFNSGTQTTATFLPQAPLPDSSTITVSLTGGSSGIVDLAGNPLATQSTSFQTMAGADFNGPVVVKLSPDSHDNSGIPVNTTFTVVFNKPLDPETVTSGGFYIYDYSIGYVPMNPILVSADGLTVTMVPTPNLGASHSGYYEWCSAKDLDGNAAACTSQSFTISSSSDTTPPTVLGTNPQNGNVTTVPTNAMIEVDFSEAVTPESLGAITLSAGGSVPITAVLNNGIYPDDTVVRLIPQELLLPNTTYSVSVSGVQDVAGNVMSAPYTFSFMTGENFQAVGLLTPSATVTTGAGAVAISTSGTLPNVLDAPTFTLVFDHAVDYATLLHEGINLRDINYTLVAGVTLNFGLSADQKTVTVTTSGLAAATTYRLALQYGYYLYDIAGNTVNFGNAFFMFTTQ